MSVSHSYDQYLFFWCNDVEKNIPSVNYTLSEFIINMGIFEELLNSKQGQRVQSIEYFCEMSQVQTSFVYHQWGDKKKALFFYIKKAKIPIDSLGFVDSLEQVSINNTFHTHYFPFAIDHAVEFQW